MTKQHPAWAIAQEEWKKVEGAVARGGCNGEAVMWACDAAMAAIRDLGAHAFRQHLAGYGDEPAGSDKQRG